MGLPPADADKMTGEAAAYTDPGVLGEGAVEEPSVLCLGVTTN